MEGEEAFEEAGEAPGWLWRVPAPWRVHLATASFLGVAGLLVLLVDVTRWVPLRSWLATHAAQPLLWYVVFDEKGPTEVLQWSLLATTAILAALTAGRLQGHARRFWLLMGVATVVLALEDAATLRHELSGLTMALADAEGRHPVRTATELVFYAGIAAIPLYALLRHGRAVWPTPARGHLLAGFGFYGLAGFASASRDIGSWYVRLGSWLDDRSGGRLGAGFVPAMEDRPVGFFLMDFILEESLELLAAGSLLAALLAYRAWRWGGQQGRAEHGEGA